MSRSRNGCIRRVHAVLLVLAATASLCVLPSAASAQGSLEALREIPFLLPEAMTAATAPSVARQLLLVPEVNAFVTSANPGDWQRLRQVLASNRVPAAARAAFVEALQAEATTASLGNTDAATRLCNPGTNMFKMLGNDIYALSSRRWFGPPGMGIELLGGTPANLVIAGAHEKPSSEVLDEVLDARQVRNRSLQIRREARAGKWVRTHWTFAEDIAPATAGRYRFSRRGRTVRVSGPDYEGPVDIVSFDHSPLPWGAEDGYHDVDPFVEAVIQSESPYLVGRPYIWDFDGKGVSFYVADLEGHVPVYELNLTHPTGQNRFRRMFDFSFETGEHTGIHRPAANEAIVAVALDLSLSGRAAQASSQGEGTFDDIRRAYAGKGSVPKPVELPNYRALADHAVLSGAKRGLVQVSGERGQTRLLNLVMDGETPVLIDAKEARTFVGKAPTGLGFRPTSFELFRTDDLLPTRSGPADYRIELTVAPRKKLVFPSTSERPE